MTQIKKNVLKRIGALGILTILIGTMVGVMNQDNNSSTKEVRYKTYKVADSSKIVNLLSPAGYRYNDDSSASKTYVYGSAVNLYFLANTIKGSSITWLNDAHTKVQVVLNGKTYVFTDGSYYYTVNGTKKSLTTARYASTKPAMDADGNPTSSAYQKIWAKRSENISEFPYLFVKWSMALNDKVQHVEYRKFSTEYMFVPASFLQEEGFMAASSKDGVTNSETCIYIPETLINTPKFTFTSTNRISTKYLANIKYTSMFNTLPADIRAIAVENYNKVSESGLPYQTLFKGQSWVTKKQVDSLNSKYADYYGNKTTVHGVDFSILAVPGQTTVLKSNFEKLGLPTDFANHICNTVLAYNDYYELNEKMVFSFTSSNGNTYKYVLGRIEDVTATEYNTIISVLVPNHPAMVGEHFMGSFYSQAASSFTTRLVSSIRNVPGYREDFNLGYEIPNNARKKFGMDPIEGNVSTWAKWREAYNNDKSKLIKTTQVFK